MSMRLSAVSDSSALRGIYAQYIDTPITFERALPTEIEFADRIRTIAAYYPYLVWEENGTVVGYAYAHRQKERESYQWNAELSVYLDREFTSGGLGKKLYAALMAILTLQGIKTVYGGVTLPNEKSERLHLSLGFRQLGTYRNTGYKCGKWHDVVCFEKAIAPYDGEPKPILHLREIAAQQIDSVLKYYV